MATAGTATSIRTDSQPADVIAELKGIQANAPRLASRLRTASSRSPAGWIPIRRDGPPRTPRTASAA